MNSADEAPEQSLIGHLVELRARLLRAVLAVLLVFIALIPFAGRIYAVLAEPLRAKLPEGAQMVAIDVASPFFAPIKLAFFVAVVVAMPIVLYQLFGIALECVAVMTDISRYLDFVLVLFLAFGFSFEVPVAVVILVLLGWVSVEQLREARSYVIVGAFVIAAVVTPPDVISQLMLAIPMCLLYELGLIVSRALVRRQADVPADPGA